MRNKNMSLLVVLVASIILGGCGNNEKEASSGTTNETNVDSKKDNKVAIEKPTIPSKSEEEIKEMVKNVMKRLRNGTSDKRARSPWSGPSCE